MGVEDASFHLPNVGCLHITGHVSSRGVSEEPNCHLLAQLVYCEVLNQRQVRGDVMSVIISEEVSESVTKRFGCDDWLMRVALA